MEQGDIYYGHLSSMNPPKDKYFVLAGIDINQNLALLAIINSEIEPSANTSRTLREMMIGLDLADYPYLKYTSKLNCSKVENKDIQVVEFYIRSGDFTYLGKLSNHHREKMVKCLLDSKKVPLAYKDIISNKTTILIEFKKTP